MFKLIAAQREAAKQREEEELEGKREDEEFDFEKIYEENELERENMTESKLEDEPEDNLEVAGQEAGGEEIKKTVSSSTHKIVEIPRPKPVKSFGKYPNTIQAHPTDVLKEISRTKSQEKTLDDLKNELRNIFKLMLTYIEYII